MINIELIPVYYLGIKTENSCIIFFMLLLLVSLSTGEYNISFRTHKEQKHFENVFLFFWNGMK